MRYKLLGNTGLRVSELCLGTMTFGEDWGWGAGKDESRRIFDAFTQAGGNFFDTADAYTNGNSERMLGEFAKDAGPRDRWVIATKYSFNTRPGDPNAGGNHRKHMAHAVEGSLQRLGTDHVDVLFVHAWDGLTPVEETMRALDDLVRAGKVFYVGVSNWPAWLVARGHTLAELRDWSRVASIQIEYSLIERTPERELIPMADALGMNVLAWSPLASGMLTGKYSRDRKGSGGEGKRLEQTNFTELSERNFAIADAVVAVARETGRSAAQVALAWLCARGRNIIPIVGARKLSQFQDNLACLDVVLSAEQIKRLDDVSAVPLGYPADFLARPSVRDFLHGGTPDRIQT
jgi:aryl-alcohol dehydrogenase-like predicted oxidoreductase